MTSGGGQWSNTIKFRFPCQFQRFLCQTVFVFSYQTGFLFCHLGQAPEVGLWGAGVARGSKIKFKHGHVWWQAEQVASKIVIVRSNWWPWGEVNDQIPLNFGFHVNFKDFYTKLYLCSHIRQDFHSVTWVKPQRWDFGALGWPGDQKNFKHGHVAYQIDGDDNQNRMQIKRIF